MIFAGIRTALAINVGTAPLAFLIGGGGLGELIFTGIDLNEPGMLLAGAIPTALLAVLVDFVVGPDPVLARAARRQSATVTRNHIHIARRHHVDLQCIGVSRPRRRGLALAAPDDRRTPQNVVVGGKNFTEQQIMAEMTSAAPEGQGLHRRRSKAGMGSAVLRQAQENGQIDVYWEYTGTSLITFNKVTDKLDAGRAPTRRSRSSTPPRASCGSIRRRRTTPTRSR